MVGVIVGSVWVGVCMWGSRCEGNGSRISGL